MNVNIDGISGLPNTYDYMNEYAANPSALILLVIIIVIYYSIFASLGGSTQAAPAETSGGIVFIEVIMWSIFIILLLLNGIKYFFDLNVTASIKNLLRGTPEVDIVIDQPGPGPVSTVPELTFEKEVFHVPDNVYNYKNAKAICKAYGANLASYNQIEKAYNSGAEWCGYGWSEDQMAYFPTQKSTFEKLQKTKGHKNDCGRPGINGGYIANPNVKFGVNCYGYKPKINDPERQLMEAQSLIPQNKSDIDFERRIDYWRNKLPDIIVSPFNHNKWSKL